MESSMTFSYDERAIEYSEKFQTHVKLHHVQKQFKDWFEELPLKEEVQSASITIFKYDEVTVGVIIGQDQIGIKIIKQGSDFIACNNLKAESTEDNRQTLKNSLNSLDLMVYSYVSREQKLASDPRYGVKQGESHFGCTMNNLSCPIS